MGKNTGSSPANPAPQKTKLADIEMQDNDSVDSAAREKHETERTLITRIIQGCAIAAIVINILAMILEWSWVMFAAGICGIGVGGAVVFFQNELRGEDTLRTVQNDLRHKVNDFAEENETLSGTVSNLQEELVPLKATEKKLDALARENGVTVEKLSGLVKTNKILLTQMKANLEADVMASMVDVVLQADRSADGIFSEREIQGMILRLKMLPTIEMNEELFKSELQVIKEEKLQISAILKLMEQVSHDEIPDDKRVFKLSDNALDKV